MDYHPEHNFAKVSLSNTLNNNAIKCKKLATIVSGRKYVARPFVLKTSVYGASLSYRISSVFSLDYIQPEILLYLIEFAFSY